MNRHALATAAALCLAAAPAAARPPIRLVMVDGKTTDAYGPLPWTRERHAKLVGRLDRAGARAIALRFYFRDDRGDAGDRALVEAVRASGRVLCELGQQAGPEGWQPEEDWLSAVSLRVEGPKPRMLMSPKHLEAPFESLARAARGVGSIQVLVNQDGKLEGLPLLIGYHGHLLPSLGLRTFLAAADLESAPLRFEAEAVTRFGFIPGRETKALHIGRTRIAISPWGAALVNLTAPGRGYQTSSFVDVLEGRVAPSAFKGAIVLVGTESADLDVETGTGPKRGLELIADQIAALYHWLEDGRR